MKRVENKKKNHFGGSEGPISRGGGRRMGAGPRVGGSFAYICIMATRVDG